MNKLILVAVTFISLNSFALMDDEEFQSRMGACKSVSAEMYMIADSLYEKDFNEKWLEIDNPTEQQKKTYNNYYEIASVQLADEIARFCE